MDELRQQFISAGWRQGVLVEPGTFGHAEACVFVVLNQTCDCINPKIEQEPWLELLPLVKLAGKPDSRMKNGRNPRQIHFQICENGKNIWVGAKIAEIFHFDRSDQLLLPIASGCILPQAVLDDLIQWRAKRYLRTAFPDAFENAFRPLTDRFAKAIGVHDRMIDSILISITPFAELSAEEQYEIELQLMIEPAVMARTADLESLTVIASELRAILQESPAFASATCHVTGLDMMTLWEAKQYLDFTRYDYLSFGQDPQTSDIWPWKAPNPSPPSLSPMPAMAAPPARMRWGCARCKNWLIKNAVSSIC